MSKYRDRLALEVREEYDACIKNAGRSYAAGARAMHELALTEGPMAVGKAACFPGHPLKTPEAIAARYVELYGDPCEQAA